MSQDYIALEWVKGEIEETLKLAQQALEAYVETPEDRSRLTFCLNYLHQIHGTLLMVEFYGAALLAEEMESLALALTQGRIHQERAALEVLMQAIIQLPHYLEHIKVGNRDLPVILLPILNELRSARGETFLSETALFAPTIGSNPPLSELHRKNLNTPEFAQWLRKVRQMMQAATLQLLQNKQPEVAKQYLNKALARLEKTLGNTPQGLVWLAALAFSEWLLQQNSLPNSARQLLRQIDNLLKEMIEQGEACIARPAPEELVKNLLFYVARTEATGEAIKRAQERFKLADALPDEQAIEQHRAQFSGPDKGTIENVLAVLIEEISALKDHFDLLVRSGDERQQALTEAEQKLKQIADTMGMLGLGMPRRVVQEQQNNIHNLISSGTATDEALLDIAGALLYVEATLKGMQAEGNFSDPSQQGSLNDAQKAVLREARNGLEQIKDAIIAYIANHWAVAELHEVPSLLHSISGSLAIIPLTKASAILSLANQFVQEHLIDQGEQPAWASMDTFADALSGVEYFLERFSSNRKNASDELLDKAERALFELTGIYASDLNAAPAEEVQEQEETTEQESAEKLEAPEVVVEEPVVEEEPEDDLIDDEILEIFLEEAEEVTETLNEFWPQFKENNDDQEAIATVRRAFHTLKGSGRMVQAETLGELAWSIENMFNRLLDNSISLSDALVALVDHVIGQLPTLIKDFENRQKASIDTQPLMDQAFAIAEGKEVAPLAEITPADGLQAADDDIQDEADTALIEIFISETQGHLATIAEFVEFSEQEEYFNPPTDILQRALHTLKGSAHMADIGCVASVATPLERLIKEWRAFQLPNSQELVQLIARGAELIGQAITDPQALAQVELQGSAELIADIQALVEKKLESQESNHNGSIGPTPQDIAQFMSHGMEALLDADRLLVQWQSSHDEEILKKLRHDLHLVSADAAKTNLPHIQVLAECLDDFYANICEQHPIIDDEVIDLASRAHESLLGMLDYLAAGQETTRPESLLEELRNWHFNFHEEITLEPLADTSDLVDESAEDNELIQIFLDEAQEISESIEQILERWKSNPEDLLQVAHLQRELHTLKGGARMTELNHIADLCHELETIYERANDGRITLPSEAFELLERAHDELSGQIDDVRFGHPQAPASILEELRQFIQQPTPAAESSEAEPEVETPVDSSPNIETIEPQEALISESMDEADREILEIFIEEAHELNEELERCLHQWKLDSDNNAHPEEAQRVLHTIKGGARLAGLADIGDISHDFETAILKAQQNGIQDKDEFFQHAYQQYDLLVEKTEIIQAALNTGELIALSEPTLVLEPMPPLSAEPETTPPAAAAPEASTEEPSTNVIPLARPNTEVVPAEPEEAKPVAQPTQQAVRQKGPQELVRVSADLLDNLVNLAGETSIGRGRLEQQVSDFSYTLDEMDMTLERLRDQLRRLDMETEAQVLFRQERQGPDYEDFDPLEMDRYSTIQQLSRALVESTSDLLDLKETLTNKNRDTETLLLQQSRINSELQEGLMQTRMVPFQQMVPRLRRIVRQVSHELDKRVELFIHGASGEMDRSILERMISPLEHMLRNAVDHGIESQAEREAAGKDPQGKIDLDISRDGGDVLIRISDDGKGINVDAVRQKALERGLINATTAISEQEIMQFILHAGFSTAAQVTQISGRGVGMDVVASEIKQMGGSIEINSERGRGSSFTIRLPFTVSVNRALMVRMGEDLYAVPLNNIQGIVRISVRELQELYKKPVTERTYHYAGTDYRLDYLGSLLDSADLPDLLPQTLPIPVLLVRGSQPYALQVDSLLGSREIVVKTLGPQFSTVMGVSGGTILGDGSVVIILDLQALIRAHTSLEHQQARELELQEAQRRHRLEQRLPQIMVVDDSVTVRKVTSRLLERNGMEVLTAKDGLDAITSLQEHIPDLMLLDIEMPRMDGFEVASQVRHSSRLKHIPIIMITSRTGDKHRERAMSIGVNEYLGKPFQEDILLAKISELLGHEHNN